MKATRPFFIAGFVTLAICVYSTHAVKQSPQKEEPRWMEQVTKSNPGKFVKVPACELVYNLSWNGLVKAGEAKLKLGLRDPTSPKYLLGTCEGESSGLAKRLWFYKHLFKSQVDRQSLRPIYFESTETEKKEKVITKARFGRDSVVSTETVRKRKGNDKGKTKERTFAYDHAHDLLSTVLYLRSFPLNTGDEINLVVHPFKSAYYTKFRVVGREKFKTKLGKKDAIKLDVQLYKIDRDDLELKSYDKFKKASIWISEDGYRMPLEIRSEVFIGSVRATLAERKVIGSK